MKFLEDTLDHRSMQQMLELITSINEKRPKEFNDSINPRFNSFSRGMGMTKPMAKKLLQIQQEEDVDPTLSPFMYTQNRLETPANIERQSLPVMNQVQNRHFQIPHSNSASRNQNESRMTNSIYSNPVTNIFSENMSEKGKSNFDKSDKGKSLKEKLDLIKKEVSQKTKSNMNGSEEYFEDETNQMMQETIKNLESLKKLESGIYFQENKFAEEEKEKGKTEKR